jgi:phosphoglycolate phosphatase
MVKVKIRKAGFPTVRFFVMGYGETIGGNRDLCKIIDNRTKRKNKMSKTNYTAVIFDCDGTLVDTLGDIAASMNRALEAAGYLPLPETTYISRVGWGMGRLASLCLPDGLDNKEEQAAALAAAALTFYARSPVVYTKVYPGIPELIGELKKRGIKTAVITNKSDNVVRMVLGGLFPPDAFDLISGDLPGRPRKPDPAGVWDLAAGLGAVPSGCLLAGDSEVDMETALAAGCFPLGVSWGYRSVAAIEGAGARRVIHRPAELLDLL